jgi:hypothetical protein
VDADGAGQDGFFAAPHHDELPGLRFPGDFRRRQPEEIGPGHDLYGGEDGGFKLFQ